MSSCVYTKEHLWTQVHVDLSICRNALVAVEDDETGALRKNQLAFAGVTSGIGPRAAIVGERAAQACYLIVAVYAGVDRRRYVGNVTSVLTSWIPAWFLGNTIHVAREGCWGCRYRSEPDVVTDRLVR